MKYKHTDPVRHETNKWIWFTIWNSKQIKSQIWTKFQLVHDPQSNIRIHFLQKSQLLELLLAKSVDPQTYSLASHRDRIERVSIALMLISVLFSCIWRWTSSWDLLVGIHCSWHHARLHREYPENPWADAILHSTAIGWYRYLLYLINFYFFMR